MTAQKIVVVAIAVAAVVVVNWIDSKGCEKRLLVLWLWLERSCSSVMMEQARKYRR
jgi:hypothetical protein